MKKRSMRIFTGLLAGLLSVVGVMLLLPGRRSLHAQAREAPNVRYPAPKSEQETSKTVLGQVLDPAGKGLARAVVHVKNKETLEVKTRISDDEGKYNFRGLDRDVDYEVHAEYQGASSSNRTVSKFDDRTQVQLDLEVNTAK